VIDSSLTVSPFYDEYVSRGFAKLPACVVHIENELRGGSFESESNLLRKESTYVSSRVECCSWGGVLRERLWRFSEARRKVAETPNRSRCRS
jgi:hypothetical protein